MGPLRRLTAFTNFTYSATRLRISPRLGSETPFVQKGPDTLLESRKDFPHGQLSNGKSYATKQVRPVLADEPNEIVVVAVSTYCF